jgi:hypothetical protein
MFEFVNSLIAAVTNPPSESSLRSAVRQLAALLIARAICALVVLSVMLQCGVGVCYC